MACRIRTLMKRALPLLAIALVCSSLAQTTRLQYPPAPTSDHVDVLHGVRVPDPYRPLEDMESPTTKAWIEAQNRLTRSFLDQVPERDRILARLTSLLKYERYGVPWKEGGRYFYTRNDGLQNQSVLLVSDSLKASPRVLLDPNSMSEGGVDRMGGYSVTRDGKYLAYNRSRAGSDWIEWRVRDVDTGKDLPDVIEWSKFSGASWRRDGKGFYYSRYDEPKPGEEMSGTNYYQKVYFHLLGTPQSADKLIYHIPEHKDWGVGGDVTDDGRYLILGVSLGGRLENHVYYRDMNDGKVVKLLADGDARYWFVGNDGPVFWFQTDLGAPNMRVIAVDIRRPERKNWKTIIAERNEPLRSVSVVGNRFFATYLRDTITVVRMYSLRGRFLGEVVLPGQGAVGGFGGRREYTETFYTYTDNKTPTVVYRYDIRTGKSTVFRKPKLDFDPDAYESKLVFYRSKDGTRIPMYITHKKGIKLDGSNPTLLSGYGGFNAAISPGFSVGKLVWMEMGGVFANPGIRGGGEYGKKWHDAGRKLNKQNCFDDFIAAAEWLIAQGYTSTPKLAIAGGSNGGLLVGACMTQRPDLFGACLPGVGVLDMLRFHKFTIGWAWVSDYGSPDDPKEFRALYAYSPYHNVRKGVAYPPTLVTTGERDDRVVPLHSFKFAAALQAAQAGEAPILLRVETQSGHGSSNLTKYLESQADEYAFLIRVLGMKVQGPVGGLR